MTAFLLAAACFGAAGCKSELETGDGNPSVISDLSDETHVNLYGRLYYNENLQGMAFVNSASGFEVTFRGTKLEISAQSIGEWQSMFSVFLDGETDSNANVITVRNSPFGNYLTVSVADGLPEGEHTVRVLKRTPSNRDTALIGSIETDGVFLTAPSRPSLKIEVFGDSITCGEGILREVVFDEETGLYRDSGVYTAQTQNVMQSYAAVAAQELNAEFRVYGRGGISMKYTKLAHSVLENPAAVAVDLEPDEYPYDYNSWTPDVVVIYLGTNDYARRNDGIGYSKEGLKAAFAEFLQTVIGKYYGKDIPIVLCSGLMVPDAELDEVMDGVKQMLPDFPNLETVEFKACAIGHPIVEENRVAGELLAAKIRELLGL